MNNILNRYSIPSEDVSNAVRFTLKYCEHCRDTFLSSRDDVRFPGDYITMQRGVGRREPALCGACQKIPLDVLYMRKEAMVMEEIAREMRASRDRFQPTSALRDSKREYARSQQHSEKPRKHAYAKWREPLMKALLEKQEMTAREMAAIIGVDMTNSQAIANAPMRVRSVGINIVVVRRERRNTGHGVYNIRLYGLSSSATPEPLTTPQDSETHQFMREVHV